MSRASTKLWENNGEQRYASKICFDLLLWRRQIQNSHPSRCKINKGRDFPGSPVNKNPCLHCRGHGVPSLVRELRSCMAYGTVQPKKNTKTKNHKDDKFH